MTPDPNPQPLFELENVSIRFDQTVALDGITLRIMPGEIIGVIGASGSGKTTLLRVLNGSTRPDGGLAMIQGKQVGLLSERELRGLRSIIGYVDQAFGLVPNLRVIQNTLLGRVGKRSLMGTLRCLVWQNPRETQAVFSILQRLGIEEKLYERTENLSHGQQQRVAIARALYQDPLCLLADEPVSSVDPLRSQQVLELLIELAQQQGLTLVAALHDLDLARALFPRLIGLRDGRIAFDRPTDEVARSKAHELYAH